MTGSADTCRSSETRLARGSWAVCAGLLLTAAVCGCSRTHYRTRADQDAYDVIAEQAAGTIWEPPLGFDVVADPRSRLFDPSPIDDPHLPEPAPQLYSYPLPDLPRRIGWPEEQRFPTPAEPAAPNEEAEFVFDFMPDERPDEGDILPIGYRPDEAAAPADGDQNGPQLPAPGHEITQDLEVDDIDVTPLLIPRSAWESVPHSCLRRMFEFPGIVTEYEQSYEAPPPDSLRDLSRRLRLEEVVQLALLNSREYQTQKEILYRAALRLTLPRYDYELKFSSFPRANRAAADYRHMRTDGETVNRLFLPLDIDADKMLGTGGNLIARFANDVVLTFNGPGGFSSDVSNELFLLITQTVFQRDVQFEALTQAERDVVYAARDFARFRKVLFNQLVGDYYGILQTYRQIEIDTQNYFTLVRALNQGRAEYRIGQAARVQVDQIEQNLLAGLTRLIGTCNRIEGQLDNFKLRIGLPTETPLNVGLTELERLTLTDEVAVAGDLVRRVSEQLQAERDRSDPDHTQILSVAVELIGRIQNSFDLTDRLDRQAFDVDRLKRLQTQLQVDEQRLLDEENRRNLQAALDDPDSPPIRRIRRLFEALDSSLNLLDRQRELAARNLSDHELLELVQQSLAEFDERRLRLGIDLEQQLDRLDVDQIAELIPSGLQLLRDVQAVIERLDRILDLDPSGDLEATLQRVDELLSESESLLKESAEGLVPVEIRMDDAMLTALVLRIELMNERGFLADDWRQIKLAADDLKSILNLSASQTLEDFDFDDSETRLTATFDAPLNRRAQRNAFRERLIDYQVARRRVMALEDRIKLSVRNDLRRLALAQDQYRLSVASAALAFERVVGTRIQLRLGVTNVQARDFLEAQTAYAAALSAVADRHITYVLARTQLFLDLELLQVDDEGFWPEIEDESIQPTPVFAFPPVPYPPYGRLPEGLHYSDVILEMLCVPPGTPWIHEWIPGEYDALPEAEVLPDISDR